RGRMSWRCAQYRRSAPGARSSRAPPCRPSSSLSGDSSGPACRASASSLVRVDQIFLPGGLLAIDHDLLDPQRLGERDLLRVGGSKGGLDLGGNPLPQLLGPPKPDLLQEGREQPAADAPGHTEGAMKFGGPAIQSAVDVDLLVRGRPIAAAFLLRAVRRRFHLD